MKRLFCIILAALFLLCGCGDNGSPAASEKDKTAITERPALPAADFTDADSLLAEMNADGNTLVGKTVSFVITDHSKSDSNLMLFWGKKLCFKLPGYENFKTGDTATLRICSSGFKAINSSDCWYFDAENTQQPADSSNSVIVNYDNIVLELPKGTLREQRSNSTAYFLKDGFFMIGACGEKRDWFKKSGYQFVLDSYANLNVYNCNVYLNLTKAQLFITSDSSACSVILGINSDKQSYLLSFYANEPNLQNVKSVVNQFMTEIAWLGGERFSLTYGDTRQTLDFTKEISRDDPTSPEYKGISTDSFSTLTVRFLGIYGTKAEPELVFDVENIRGTGINFHPFTVDINGKQISADITPKSLGPREKGKCRIRLFGLSSAGISVKNIKTVKANIIFDLDGTNKNVYYEMWRLFLSL